MEVIVCTVRQMRLYRNIWHQIYVFSCVWICLLVRVICLLWVVAVQANQAKQRRMEAALHQLQPAHNEPIAQVFYKLHIKLE